ncbi:MAG: hypothetical protein O2787_05390 [Cyanobacteria bacterium]|nr:hypothetical protein [Cyanobacteriota bacterium]
MSQHLVLVSAKPPLAIRSAVERGWAAFSHCPWVLMGFTLLSGGANLAAQLLYRYESGLVFSLMEKPNPVAIALAAVAWSIYALTGLWLVVGLMRGAQLALNQGQPKLADLIRVDGRAMLRCFGTVVLILLVLALIVRLAQASSWLLTLIQPFLAPLPLVAGLVAIVYLSADQILSLPLALIGGLNPLAAFRSGRAATDPHWLQALGLTLVLLAMVLAGFLVLLVGLLVTLPVAACTLTAAYQQLFDQEGRGHLTAA